MHIQIHTAIELKWNRTLDLIIILYCLGMLVEFNREYLVYK